MTFEVFRTAKGEYRWRLRDEKGEVVSVKPGKIMLPKQSPAQKRVYKRAVQIALKQHFEEQEKGPRRRSSAKLAFRA